MSDVPAPLSLDLPTQAALLAPGQLAPEALARLLHVGAIGPQAAMAWTDNPALPAVVQWWRRCPNTRPAAQPLSAKHLRMLAPAQCLAIDDAYAIGLPERLVIWGLLQLTEPLTPSQGRSLALVFAERQAGAALAVLLRTQPQVLDAALATDLIDLACREHHHPHVLRALLLTQGTAPAGVPLLPFVSSASQLRTVLRYQPDLTQVSDYPFLGLRGTALETWRRRLQRHDPYSRQNQALGHERSLDVDTLQDMSEILAGHEALLRTQALQIDAPPSAEERNAFLTAVQHTNPSGWSRLLRQHGATRILVQLEPEGLGYWLCHAPETTYAHQSPLETAGFWVEKLGSELLNTGTLAADLFCVAARAPTLSRPGRLTEFAQWRALTGQPEVAQAVHAQARTRWPALWPDPQARYLASVEALAQALATVKEVGEGHGWRGERQRRRRQHALEHLRWALGVVHDSLATLPALPEMTAAARMREEAAETASKIGRSVSALKALTMHDPALAEAARACHAASGAMMAQAWQHLQRLALLDPSFDRRLRLQQTIQASVETLQGREEPYDLLSTSSWGMEREFTQQWFFQPLLAAHLSLQHVQPSTEGMAAFEQSIGVWFPAAMVDGWRGRALSAALEHAPTGRPPRLRL